MSNSSPSNMQKFISPKYVYHMRNMFEDNLATISIPTLIPLDDLKIPVESVQNLYCSDSGLANIELDEEGKLISFTADDILITVTHDLALGCTTYHKPIIPGMIGSVHNSDLCKVTFHEKMVFNSSNLLPTVYVDVINVKTGELIRQSAITTVKKEPTEDGSHQYRITNWDIVNPQAFDSELVIANESVITIDYGYLRALCGIVVNSTATLTKLGFSRTLDEHGMTIVQSNHDMEDKIFGEEDTITVTEGANGETIYHLPDESGAITVSIVKELVGGILRPTSLYVKRDTTLLLTEVLNPAIIEATNNN